MNLSQLKTWACGALLVAASAICAQTQGNEFNTPGNVLISDQYNNRVIEVNPKNHKVVWRFGNGSSVAGPHSVVGVNDAQRIGPFTLVAGTGVPAGAEPTCPNGCGDNRVMIVDPSGNIIWHYGHAGVAGSGPDQLNTPVQNTWLPNGHILYAYGGNPTGAQEIDRILLEPAFFQGDCELDSSRAIQLIFMWLKQLNGFPKFYCPDNQACAVPGTDLSNTAGKPVDH